MLHSAWQLGHALKVLCSDTKTPNDMAALVERVASAMPNEVMRQSVRSGARADKPRLAPPIA